MVNEVARRKQSKHKSVQTDPYIEYIPPPIIVDIKSESDSDPEEIPSVFAHYVDDECDNGNETEHISDTLKIEFEEFDVIDESNAIPIEEPQNVENVNPYIPCVVNIQAEIPKEVPNIVAKTPKKRKSKQNAEKPNETKTKRVKKDKKSDKKQVKAADPSSKETDCKLCSFTCKRPSDLKRHMLMHTGEKPHKCEHCEKGFAQKTDLNRHIIVHAAQYEFHCSSCGRGFSDDESTKKHEQKCNTKRYICDICNYMTFNTGNLLLHKRKHTGERPFACGSCDKRFSRVSHLNKHVKLHSDEFEMHCSLCGRGFSEQSEMLAHEAKCKNHILQCFMCGEIHYRFDNLRRHIKVAHLGEKEVMCEYCSRRFLDRSGLNKHIKAIHNKDKDLLEEPFLMTANLTSKTRKRAPRGYNIRKENRKEKKIGAKKAPRKSKKKLKIKLESNVSVIEDIQPSFIQFEFK